MIKLGWVICLVITMVWVLGIALAYTWSYQDFQYALFLAIITFPGLLSCWILFEET